MGYYNIWKNSYSVKHSQRHTAAFMKLSITITNNTNVLSSIHEILTFYFSSLVLILNVILKSVKMFLMLNL